MRTQLESQTNPVNMIGHPALCVKENVSMDPIALSGALGNDVESGDQGVSHHAREFPPPHTSSYGFIATLLMSLILFWAPVHHLVKFSGHSEYSYIPLIPPISAFLIFVRRDSIFRFSKASPLIGSSIVFGGIVVLFISNRQWISPFDRLELSALAVVSTWVGLFVLWYGARVMRAAILPLSLLLFMIPAPERATNALIEFLQHGSAALSYCLFRAIGVPAMREGMTISLPRLTIEVAPQCSGIRSSISLLILTLAGANLYLRSGWNKILLVFLLVPLCILKNAIRIVALSTLALYVDVRFLTGPLHQRGGILFFFIAIAILIPIILVMQRFEKKRGDSWDVGSS